MRAGERSGGGRFRRGFGLKLVLRPEVKIARVMTLVQLAGGIPAGPVADPARLAGRPAGDQVRPWPDMSVFRHAQKLGRPVRVGPHEAAVPGPDGHGRDRVAFARYIFALLEAPVEDVELT